jgi:hypothetical protein
MSTDIAPASDCRVGRAERYNPHCGTGGAGGVGARRLLSGSTRTTASITGTAQGSLLAASRKANGPVLRSVFDGLPAGVRYLEPQHLDRTVSDVNRLDELCDELIARQTGEHRGGAAVSHHDCLAYADVP